MKMRIEVTPEEALRGKFDKTIRRMVAAMAEAREDCDIDRDWTSEAVLDRIQGIRDAFEEELKFLAKGIVVKGNNRCSNVKG